MDREGNLSFGVFKPVGHVVISFPTAAQADAAVAALTALQLPADAVRRYSDSEMLAQIQHDRQNASPLAAIGQELNLVKAHEDLARLGYHWLVVRVKNDDQAAQLAAAVRPCGAEGAQHYGHFIIEELIERSTDLPQVGESPDRGLDAQTPSGEIEEKAGRRPAPRM